MFVDTLFHYLETFEMFLWSYVGIILIIALGVFLTIKSRFFQLRQFFHSIKTFISFIKESEDTDARGLHPIKLFFASVGGCIGIGNLVTVCIAVQIGGPGALFWIWVTAFLGMILKYSEIYLGLRYRVANKEGGYDGGPMYFLQHAFKWKWLPKVVCLLLCVYGVEIFMFDTIVDSISINWEVPRLAVMIPLLALILITGIGGINRVGKVSSFLIPIFIVVYIVFSVYILVDNGHKIPAMLSDIFVSAFTGHAAVGGFLGGTVIMAMTKGVEAGCYSGDVGIGYASVIHSESQVCQPKKQAILAIVAIFLDTFVVCTATVLIVLITDVWSLPIEGSLLVQQALHQYFPYMQVYMPIFIFLLGFSTITAYFCVGAKCAKFLLPKHGSKVFYVYAALAFVLFSFIEAKQALTIMMIAGGLLIVVNLIGIMILRKQIDFTNK